MISLRLLTQFINTVDSVFNKLSHNKTTEHSYNIICSRDLFSYVIAIIQNNKIRNDKNAYVWSFAVIFFRGNGWMEQKGHNQVESESMRRRTCRRKGRWRRCLRKRSKSRLTKENSVNVLYYIVIHYSKCACHDIIISFYSVFNALSLTTAICK